MLKKYWRIFTKMLTEVLADRASCDMMKNSGEGKWGRQAVEGADGMEWLTLSDMLARIQIGQKASTPGFTRTVIRRPDGLYWCRGVLDGKIVEVRDYLFSDVWTLYEDEESLQWIKFKK